LPWVHIVISNLKRFLLGTFHGVQGKYLQEYINEFCGDSSADVGNQKYLPVYWRHVQLIYP